jgi:galactose-1-phosphate uridylyltransferase
VVPVKIQFETGSREAKFLSPFKNFEPVTQGLEHRRDPLTGRGSIVIKGRLDYVKSLIETDQTFLDELVESTRSTCPFCPAAVEGKSPQFLPELAPEGRIRVGEAICFPSLFAHEDFNAVVVPTPKHSLTLDNFTTTMLRDGFKACLVYFGKAEAYARKKLHAMIAMNFLPPAGSTVAHPHIQALASDIPLQGVAELQQRSKEYFESHRASYWEDLVLTEKELGERYLGGIGCVDWLTPFAPFGFCDVQGIVSGKAAISSLSNSELEDLMIGLSKVLRFYHENGIRSFNAAIYSGLSEESERNFRVSMRIVARYGYKPRFVSDIWALQYLFGEREVSESPEETCTRLKKYFRN